MGLMQTNKEDSHTTTSRAAQTAKKLGCCALFMAGKGQLESDTIL
jgi:hypothetical protein